MPPCVLLGWQANFFALLPIYLCRVPPTRCATEFFFCSDLLTNPRIPGRKYTFNAYELLDQLQPAALDFWNLIFTRRGVITVALSEGLARSATKSQSFRDFSRELEELQNADFYRLMSKYYDVAAMRHEIELSKIAAARAGGTLDTFSGRSVREPHQPTKYFDLKVRIHSGFRAAGGGEGGSRAEGSIREPWSGGERGGGGQLGASD